MDIGTILRVDAGGDVREHRGLPRPSIQLLASPESPLQDSQVSSIHPWPVQAWNIDTKPLRSHALT